jgi:dCMP deaminase
MKIVIAYVPVLHEGYYKFFMKHSDAHTLYVLGRTLTGDYRPLIKDLRAMDPSLIALAVRSFDIFSEVIVLENGNVASVREKVSSIVIPNEDECVEIINRHFSRIPLVKEAVFLRWDRSKSLSRDPISSQKVVSLKDFDQKMMSLAFSEATRSVDWWRQVASVLVKDKIPLIAIHNKHVPSEYVLSAFGDPRANFRRGVHIEASSVLHSESAVVAWAARTGTSLLDADLYVTTFPCPPCAKLIAYSGIRRLFYAEGYAVLDGEDILQSQGVEIIRVKI